MNRFQMLIQIYRGQLAESGRLKENRESILGAMEHLAEIEEDAKHLPNCKSRPISSKIKPEKNEDCSQAEKENNYLAL